VPKYWNSFAQVARIVRCPDTCNSEKLVSVTGCCRMEKRSSGAKLGMNDFHCIPVHEGKTRARNTKNTY
jgi:hypothetical protein